MNNIITTLFYIGLLISLISKSLEITIIDNGQNFINKTNDEFEKKFLFGAATAAYQIEGGWNLDGKGPSIWDQFTHEHPEYIDDKSTADIGPDSYHFYEADINALKECGMNFYRFSISWSRILPTGDITSLNKAGVNYYHNLINKLLENNIEPMITMYHYDLPQTLMNLGGLVNSEVVKYFEDYATILFNEYGNRVKWWITFNEPFDFCVEGYGTGESPPLKCISGIGEYLCVDTVLKAHAVVYHLYKNKYYNKFNGKIGISLSSRFFYAKYENDTNIVDRAMQYQLGWLAHPLYIGNYPPVMIENILSNSLREDRLHSRLPIMTEQWINYIKGTLDFLGLNYYTSRLIELAENPMGMNPSWQRDSKLNMTTDSSWIRSKSSWLYMVPKGLGDILRWIRDEYDNPEVIITENGWSDNGQINDIERINYIREHLKELLNAINIDKCNVTGYAMWSIIDNFEWSRGYTEKFGLYSVNMTSLNKERTPKQSAYFIREIIQTRKIPSS